ncbi:hypothetical protein IAU60_000743 [Kwoniella sp. DSM 27419]
MESYTLDAFPSAFSRIHIALFDHVSNSPEIRKRLIAASVALGDEGDRLKVEVDYGFVEADLLVSKEHLLTAIFTTLLYALPSQSTPDALPQIDSLSISLPAQPILEPLPSSHPSNSAANTDAPGSTPKPKTRTHNIHSELLMSLSPNNNITDSIRRHGISDKTTRLAVVKITGPDERAEDVYRGIAEVVRGELVSWDSVEEGTDWPRVDKTYKLSELNAVKSVDNRAKKIVAVVSSVAIKNVI